MRLILLIVLVLLPVAVRAQTVDELVPGLREAVLRPAVDEHRRSIATLRSALSAFCAAPGADRLAAPRNAFRAVMASWQRLAPVAQGPLGDASLAAGVYFWPDKHGTASRQLSRALAAEDAKLTTSEGVEGASAALGGLGALELLLWGDPPAVAEGGFGCDYARAIAAVQEGYAARLSTILDASEDPAAEGQAVLTTVQGGLDAVIRLKLEEPLGSTPDKARGTRAEAWRSGTSLANVRANLAMLKDLVVAPRGIAQAAIGGPETQALAIIVERRFDRAIRAVAAVPLPLDRAVTDPAARPTVTALVQEVRNLRTLIGDRLGPALGLATGFNATDGD